MDEKFETKALLALLDLMVVLTRDPMRIVRGTPGDYDPELDDKLQSLEKIRPEILRVLNR
jgi:hypothetical protein